MTVATSRPGAARAGQIGRPAPLVRCSRFEVIKLLSHWWLRVLLAVCAIVPGGFVAVVSRQNSLPADTVFGRWMHSTGWAGALVVLGFACSWALPLLTALVAGDVFALEDRLGTWRHLVIAARSPRRIFLAKVSASVTVILLLVAVVALSGMVGGIASVGDGPLTGLDGYAFSGRELAGRVLLAWVCVLAPTLAFTAVGFLGSVTLGRSPVGLLLPAGLAMLLALGQMLPLPAAVRLALPGQALITWRGLFTQHAQTGPLLIGVAVALAWALAATGGAYLIFVRRDFTDLANDGSGRRLLTAGLLPLAALTAASVLVIAVTTPVTGSGIGRGKLERSLATSYAHLYRLQSAELHGPAVTETQLRTTASCDKGGLRGVDEGPGTDWRCVVTWHLPGATAVGSASYQLDVTADGRYVADGDGPREVNGNFSVRTSYGDSPNPLWQFDGTVDLLTPIRKD